MTHAAEEKSWYQQGAVWLSIAALLLAGFALLSHRDEIRRAQREEFRKLVTQLQETTTGATTGPDSPPPPGPGFTSTPFGGSSPT